MRTIPFSLDPHSRCARFRLRVVLLALALVGCAGGAVAAELDSIELSPNDRLSLLPGSSGTLRATARYDDGSTADVTTRLSYTVSRPAVLSVGADGRVTALAPGDADVSAVDPVSGLTARNRAKFKVVKLSSIALTPDASSVRLGGTIAFRAIGTYNDGTTDVDLTEVLEWRTDKPKIAVVSNEPGKRGLVTGVGGGIAKIRAVDPVTGRKSAKTSGQVTVTRHLLSLAVDPPEHVLQTGAKTRFRTLGLFEDSAVAEVTKDVDWRVDPPDVAVIDRTGQVRALAAGVASVRAVDRKTGLSTGDFGNDAVLRVTGPLREIAVVPAAVTLDLAEPFALGAYGVFQGRSEPLALTANLRWKSSVPATATVDASGKVTCVKSGTTSISVKDNRSGLLSTGLGGDGRVTCLGPARALRVAPSSNVLAVGKGKQMQAFLIERDGTESEVTRSVRWSSSNSSVVSIVDGGANTGRATAVSPGIATITASDPANGVTSNGPGGTSAKLSVAGVPESVTIFPRPSSGSSLVASVGEDFQLKARVQYQGGATEGINALVTWTSSHPSIVRIADGSGSLPAGRAELLRAGTVTVTITYPKIGAPPPANPPTRPLTDSIQLTVRP